MKIQEKLIFGGGNNGSKGVQFESDQHNNNNNDDDDYHDAKTNGLYAQKQVEKKLASKNMMIEHPPSNGQVDRSVKQIDTLLKEGKKQAGKDSVVHKNQQKFNTQVDEQLKKQNVVQKKGAIKSGFDVIATTNQLLKKQYEESIRLEEFDNHFVKMEQKYTEMIDNVRFMNKKKEGQLSQMAEQLQQQQLKVNGDNYWQSQLANVSVNANNSNILSTNSYYSNKFTTTLNQHSILGCRATSNFTLKDNQENLKIIQSRVDDLKMELEEVSRKQFAEETLKENMEYKVKEIQATQVVLQKEISNQNIIVKNYDIQLNELNQKLEEYEKVESSFANQNQTMVKFISADEQQRKQFLNKRKGNYECYKIDIRNALQDHNQIQEQISKSTIQIEKMKLEIEELDYQAKNKRQLTQQSREILSVLENFDLLCDVFIYNDPAISNIMEIDSAYELTNKKRVVEFQETNNAHQNNQNRQTKKKLNSIGQQHQNNQNHQNASAQISSSSTQQQLSAIPISAFTVQRIQSTVNSKDNSPAARNKSKNNEDNLEQSKSKFSEAAAAVISPSSNMSFSANDKETNDNNCIDQAHKLKESQVNIDDDIKTGQNEDQQDEEVQKIGYLYKQGDIILRLTQFYTFHRNDLEKAVDSVIQVFKSYNNDHDTLKTRIVDLSVQKKNLTQVYKKLEKELWEFILVFGDIKKQEEEDELQKKINRRLNKQNTDLFEDQDSASKNLLSTNHKKNNFNEQNTDLDLAYNAQIFEGQCFLFLNESLFRISKTVNSIKYIICYSELFKEDMDVQNYYFKNDLFKDIPAILKFSLEAKMVYQEADAPFMEQKVNTSTSESNRQSISDDLMKNQLVLRDQPIEKSSHTQVTLAKSIIQKYLKSCINKLVEIKNIFLQKFCPPQIKKHEKLDSLIELIRNDVVMMYFCSIETFTKFAGDIKENFMRQYDIEAVQDDKQINNLFSFVIDHLNELRDQGENAFRVYLRRLIGFYEYILIHSYLQSDKVWYDIKAFDPKFFLSMPKKSDESKRKIKRTWREKLVANKIKEYENYLGGEQEKNDNFHSTSMNAIMKDQILNGLNIEGLNKNEESDFEENNFFEEKREDLKYPKVSQEVEAKRKAYSFASSSQDEIANTTATTLDNKYIDPIQFKQQQQQQKSIVRIDKQKMQEELQRCIGIKKNFQRRIQETDLAALSKSHNLNNSTLNAPQQPSFKLNSSSFNNIVQNKNYKKAKTEEIQSIHNMDYPFSRVFYQQKAQNPRQSQSAMKQNGNSINQSMTNYRKEETDVREQQQPKLQKRAQSTEHNSKPKNLPTSVERKVKTSQESKKFEQKKQQSLPIIRNNNNILLSASQRNIEKNLLPHQRHIANPSASSIRFDPNQSRITDAKSDAAITKKNSSIGIQQKELNTIQLGSIIQKTQSSQSQKRKILNRQALLNQMPIEELLNKQIYSVDNETNIIPSGILNNDFNRNRSIFPNIPSGITDYSIYSNKSSALL